MDNFNSENFGSFQTFAENNKRGVFRRGTALMPCQCKNGWIVSSDISRSCEAYCDSNYICLTSRFYDKDNIADVTKYFEEHNVKTIILLQDSHTKYRDYEERCSEFENNGWTRGDYTKVTWLDIKWNEKTTLQGITFTRSK